MRRRFAYILTAPSKAGLTPAAMVPHLATEENEMYTTDITKFDQYMSTIVDKWTSIDNE